MRRVRPGAMAIRLEAPRPSKAREARWHAGTLACAQSQPKTAKTKGSHSHEYISFMRTMMEEIDINVAAFLYSRMREHRDREPGVLFLEMLAAAH